MKLSVTLFSVALLVSFGSATTCIPWVGGATEYIAGDCVTLDATTYWAVRPVNAWTHPTDTWHWTTVEPTTQATTIQGNVVLDPLAVAVNRTINNATCPATTKDFPLSEQNYTVQKDGLFVVDATLLVAQISAGEGKFFVDVTRNGVKKSANQSFLVEPYQNTGHYRESNVKNQIEVTAGDQIVVKTWVQNSWVDIGNYVTCMAATIENTNVFFYEGGRLLSTTTSLQRQ